MSAPYMAGIAALWLEANPLLTHQEIKEIAMKTAINDKACNEDNHFIDEGRQAGAGKIDAYAGLMYILNENETTLIKTPEEKSFLIRQIANGTYEAYQAGATTMSATLYNMDGKVIASNNSNGNTIVFKEATAIEAGKPYLIKWANSSSAAVNVEKKFEGVTLVAAATPVEVNKGGISFNGFYKMTEARELGASVAAIGAGNKLFKVTEGKMKGFRAAFVLSSGAEATKYNVVIDGTATGIEDLVIDGVKANGRVYNLNGQYVGNSLNGLQPGLYIQNGKKIVVK